MFRGAVIGDEELRLLRRIEDVVRLGHVRRIDRHEITLDEGRIPTSEGTLHVHCAARGLSHRPLRPIFEPGRVTVQPFRWGFACYQYAMLGVVESTLNSDEEKNLLCPAIAYWDADADYLSSFLATLANERALAAYPALANWAKNTRLSPLSQISQFRDVPGVIESRERIKQSGPAAAGNLLRLLEAGRAKQKI